MYDRGFTYLALLVALLAGYGLAEVRRYTEVAVRHVVSRATKDRVTKWPVTRVAAIAIPVVLCLVNVGQAVPAQEDMVYYQLLQTRDFDAFDWLHRNLDRYRDEYHDFAYGAVSPKQAVSFSAISGVYTLSSNFHPRYGRQLAVAMDVFLNNRAVNTSFLERYDIGVVYDPLGVNNSHLSEVYQYTYLYRGVPPRADFTVDPVTPAAGKEVMFTSTASTLYGRLVDWQWSLNGEDMEGSITGLTLAEGQNLRAPLGMNGSFTVDLWLRPGFDSDDGRDHEWFLWQGGGGYVMLYKHSNSRLYFVVRQDTWRAAWTVIPFRAGEWHHLAAAYQGGQFLLYWDGNLVRFDSGGDRLVGGAGTLTLGGRANRWFNGTLGQVRLYNRVLTAQEVADSYAGGPPGEGLAGWWPLDDGREVAVERLSGGAVEVGDARWLHQSRRVFEEPGMYTVSYTVRNQDGLTDTVIRNITVS
ncbi:MAG: LamG-like jellyroll fold domain-containing protein [Thermoplasmatota archaeon]